MKIIVHNQENNISLRLPGWLVYGRFSIRIVTAAIRKATDTMYANYNK